MKRFITAQPIIFSPMPALTWKKRNSSCIFVQERQHDLFSRFYLKFTFVFSGEKKLKKTEVVRCHNVKTSWWNSWSLSVKDYPNGNFPWHFLASCMGISAYHWFFLHRRNLWYFVLNKNRGYASWVGAFRIFIGLFSLTRDNTFECFYSFNFARS